MRGAAFVCIAALLAGCTASNGGPPSAGDPQPWHGGLVASSQHFAAEAGAEILRQGGNAVDAAAAVQWALNVVEPSMSGLGGGAFLVLYFADSGQIVTLDGREESPAASTRDQFLDPFGKPREYESVRQSGLAVGVPGTLAVFDLALDRYGSMELGRTMAPAIRLARDGFPVSDRLHGYIHANREVLGSWAPSARIYLRDAVCATNPLPCTGGRAPAVGETLTNPDLAATFELLAAQGPGVFYRGEIGRAMVTTVLQRQGRMTIDDVAGYAAVERTPVRFEFNGAEIVSMGPPSSGGLTMAQTLLLLDPFDLRRLGNGSADALHMMSEAMHLAWADRDAYIGDPDVVRVPMTGMVHPDYVAARRALLDERRTHAVEPGDPWAFEAGGGRPGGRGARGSEGFHTTHFTVVDARGNMAVVTTTLENLFGTGMVVPGYGFLLNNELTDFDWVPGGPNEIGGGKRPRSSMTPTIVLHEGRPVVGLGAPGGATIIASVAQTVLNVEEFGMDAASAVASPRIYSPYSPNLAFEGDMDPGIREALEEKGHRVREGLRLGTVNAAQRLANGTWVGVADGRSSEGGVAYAPAVVASAVTPSGHAAT